MTVAPAMRTISRLTANDKRPVRASGRRKLHAHHPDLFQWAGILAPHRDIAPPFDPRKAIKFAVGIWHASMDARHAVLCERWCASQNLKLPDDIDGDVLRFHPSLKFGNDRAPGLIWLLRDVFTDEPIAIQRLFLDQAGSVIGRRTLGRTKNAAVKLDADENVATGLVICADVVNAIAAMNAGLRPIWFVNSLADFPLMPAIEALTIITTPDDAEALAVAKRWCDAGREVIIASNEKPQRVVRPHCGEFSVDHQEVL